MKLESQKNKKNEKKIEGKKSTFNCCLGEHAHHHQSTRLTMFWMIARRQCISSAMKDLLWTKENSFKREFSDGFFVFLAFRVAYGWNAGEFHVVSVEKSDFNDLPPSQSSSPIPMYGYFPLELRSNFGPTKKNCIFWPTLICSDCIHSFEKKIC